MRKVIGLLAAATAAAAAAAFGVVPSGAPAIVFAGAANAAGEAPYEVWAIDQSDSRPGFGGRLYVYDGPSLAGTAAATARPEVVDLGGAAADLCRERTGAPGTRPHMVFFNAAQTHAVVSYVASGNVLFLDARTREPVGCVRSTGTATGRQAHAAVPTPDGRYVLVANQNGKLLERVRTDYATNTFVLEPAATLDLADGTTPSGAPRQGPERPDNAPVCPVVESSGRFAFVTLRGGGLFVVDVRATPMAIVAEYDRATVHPNGCGGAETAGKMYVDSGGGTSTNVYEFDVYAFDLSRFSTTPSPPNTPAPKLVISDDERVPTDAHGMAMTKQGRYLWVADRAANRIVVVDAVTDAPVGEFRLDGRLSGDPSPDLLAVSPSGNRVFATLRGSRPLTGDPHASTGSSPGVGVIRVEQGGRRGVLQAIARISNPDGVLERADPHAIALRTP